MKNQDLDYLNKGKYIPMKPKFLEDATNALGALSALQKEYELNDSDTVLNLFRDALVGKYLGFSLPNRNKHGMDCKLSAVENCFLESKAINFSYNMAATFNDTTEEKAAVFKDKKVWLAVSVWKSVNELMFICYGQNEKIGEYLLKHVKSQTKESKRRTQTISLTSLIFNYGFKLIAVSLSKDKLYDELTALHPTSFKKLDKDIICDLSEFVPPYIEKPEVRFNNFFNFLKDKTYDGIIGFTTEQFVDTIANKVKVLHNEDIDDNAKRDLTSALNILKSGLIGIDFSEDKESSNSKLSVEDLNKLLANVIVSPLENSKNIEDVNIYMDNILDNSYNLFKYIMSKIN